MEVLWKVVGKILDSRLRAIQFHDMLHGSVAFRGTGTAIIEAKLFQELTSIHQVPAFEIFIDLRKAYDTVDRARLLGILEGYGVGPKARGLLHSYWTGQKVVAKQGGYYAKDVITPSRGVIQGDVLSPTLFLILTDAVIRHWLSLVMEDGSENHPGLGRKVKEVIGLFYVDDGMIWARDHQTGRAL